MKNRDLEIIEKLIEHEEKIVDLYSIFADSSEDYKHFWVKLGNEEEIHVDLLKQLKDIYLSRELFIKECCFTPQSIANSIEYIESIMEKSEEGEYSDKKSLALALDLENAMIEKRYFNIFEFSSSRYAHVPDQICNETKDHKEMIYKILSKMNDSGV